MNNIDLAKIDYAKIISVKDIKSISQDDLKSLNCITNKIIYDIRIKHPYSTLEAIKNVVDDIDENYKDWNKVLKAKLEVDFLINNDEAFVKLLIRNNITFTNMIDFLSKIEEQKNGKSYMHNKTFIQKLYKLYIVSTSYNSTLTIEQIINKCILITTYNEELYKSLEKTR